MLAPSESNEARSSICLVQKNKKVERKKKKKKKKKFSFFFNLLHPIKSPPIIHAQSHMLREKGGKK